MFEERLFVCARRAASATTAVLLCAAALFFPAVVLGIISSGRLDAQEVEKSVEITTTPDGAVQVQPAAPMTQPPAATPTPEQPNPGQPAPGQPGSPMPMPMPMPMPGTAPAAEGVTTRPARPGYTASADELKVLPDEDGKIKFSFNGQPWPDVLEWFARISGRTLDWQELPADYLNLALSRPYTLDESRNLLNRHLLARGFTFLEHPEGFSVVKIDKINPALVPRISPAELDKRMSYEFVKVSFDLDWLIADELVKELESLKSPNGKLIALPVTNRLEAMDAVINLREISRMLSEEQSDTGRKELVREFELAHVKAADVQKQLEKFLGIDSGGGATAMPGMSPEQMAMIQQQQAQMAAMQAQAQAAQPGGAAPVRKTEMRLVSDPVRNRIIAHGPPDKIALIESFIRVADVPAGGPQSLEAMLSRVRVYRLASLDPEQFVQSLNELGGLDPLTRVRPDPKNNAIIVDGSLVDHYTIKSLIEKLDGSGRRFEVIALRRNSAEEVAGSIELLMGANEKDNNNNNRFYEWDFFGYGYGNQRDDRKKDTFRVGANVEFNQLLLWANDIELEEVRKLLVKLGEITESGSGGRVRTIEIPRDQSPAEVLERLKEIWPSISPNPLELPDKIPPRRSDESPTAEDDETGDQERKSADDPSDEEPSEAKPSAEEPSPDAIQDTKERIRKIPAGELITQALLGAALVPQLPAAGTTDTSAPSNPAETSDAASGGNGAADTASADTEGTGLATDAGATATDAGATAADADDADERLGNPLNSPDNQSGFATSGVAEDQQLDEQRSSPPPVKVTFGPNGELILSSQDTEALNLMEQFLEDSVPKPRDYHVFRLRYAPALYVKWNLEDFFKEEGDDNDQFLRRWWGMGDDSGNRRQLGKRKKLKFVDDKDTNTIVVVGADEEQLETIAQLVKMYDVPEEVSSQNTRVTKIFYVRYSRASAIAATIKDTFIDLLSSNDRALQNNQGEQNERPTATVIRNFGPSLPGSSEQREKRTQISFKGKLSIGVDDITNTLIVSAEGESLLNIVGEIIEKLDRAAMPEEHVEVVPFAGNSNYSRLQKALSTMLTTPQQPAQQPQPQPGQQPNATPPAQPPAQPAVQPIIIQEDY